MNKDTQYHSSSGNCKSKPCNVTSYPLVWTLSKKLAYKKCWQGCREIKTLVHCWDYKTVLPVWQTVWHFLKKLKIELTYGSSNPTSGSISKRTEDRLSKRYLHTQVHCSIFHNSQDVEAT